MALGVMECKLEEFIRELRLGETVAERLRISHPDVAWSVMERGKPGPETTKCVDAGILVRIRAAEGELEQRHGIP